MRKSLHLSFYSHFNSLDSQALALLVTSACLLLIYIYIYFFCLSSNIYIIFHVHEPYLRSITSCRMPFICLQGSTYMCAWLDIWDLRKSMISIISRWNKSSNPIKQMKASPVEAKLDKFSWLLKNWGCPSKLKRIDIRRPSPYAINKEKTRHRRIC